MPKIAFALAAHPDDIEFMMAGTMLLLAENGYTLHYMTMTNGSCGSTTLGPEEIAAVRCEEAREAAALLGATWHEPLIDDLQIYYCHDLITRLAAVVRQIDPEIFLLPSPADYIEDHQNTSRVGVTAAFMRMVPNFDVNPPTPPAKSDMAVYHAMPAGLCGPLREPIEPDLFVDITAVIEAKSRALACHQSQKDWLDATQGMGSYVKTMEDWSAEMGRRSGRFASAEGWRKHLHLGFADEAFDPLVDALPGLTLTAPDE
jgi:LmbE family N-acetylglucosaminyl deacetylase